MDGQRFDDFARGLASGVSRRRVIRGLVAGAVGAVAGALGLFVAACCGVSAWLDTFARVMRLG